MRRGVEIATSLIFSFSTGYGSISMQHGKWILVIHSIPHFRRSIRHFDDLIHHFAVSILHLGSLKLLKIKKSAGR